MFLFYKENEKTCFSEKIRKMKKNPKLMQLC